MCLLVVAALGQPLRAQTPMPLPRLDGPITLDGLSDEAAWQAVVPLPMVMYEPTFEGTVSERTEIRVAYDGSYLYAAARLYDQEPAGIRANSLYRDRWSGDDTFGIILDTYNDNENALWFFTNPLGVRFDQSVSNDAEGGGPLMPPFNTNWNTFWDVATLQTEEGWFVEMRIPYSSLGFQDTDGQVEMGLIAYRYIARKNERHLFPAIPPNWSMGFAKPSQAQQILLNNVRSQKPLYLTPYALSGLGQENHLNATETAYHFENDLTREIGLDLKYNVTSNLTLDATVNTDFAQVEADDQQINLTRFSLFFPEKRQFFQERASLFDFNTSFFDRLFHSRQIGLRDGQPVRILGGARLVGRAGAWDVGVLNMQTAETRDVAGENFGVLRLRRQLFNGFSYAGGMLTSRLGLDGRYHVAYGLDGLFRLFGAEYLTVQWAQTHDEDVRRGDAFDLGAASLLRIEWEHRQQQGWNYSAQVNRAGAAYRPRVGFIQRTNFTRLQGRLGRGWLPGGESPFRSITPDLLFADVYLRNEDGTVESGFWGSFFNFQMKSGASGFIGGILRLEDLRATLQFPNDTEVPVGRHLFFTVNSGYTTTRARQLSARINLSGGTFYDGRRYALTLAPTWNLSRYLEVSGDYQANIVRFPGRDQSFTTHLIRLRGQAALNTKVSANVFVQYNSAADVVTPNVRFRYNFREGNDLWIVYNEGFNTHRDALEPMLPLTDTRTVLLKYTYTFGS